MGADDAVDEDENAQDPSPHRVAWIADAFARAHRRSGPARFSSEEEENSLLQKYADRVSVGFTLGPIDATEPTASSKEGA